MRAIAWYVARSFSTYQEGRSQVAHTHTHTHTNTHTHTHKHRCQSCQKEQSVHPMSVGYFPATPMEPVVWFSEALMVATSTVSISCHSSPVLHACVPLCFSSRHWAQSPLKQASIVEGPIWKCGWWTWNSGHYVIWGQQTHLWSLFVKRSTNFMCNTSWAYGNI